jgi:hypothetical protein
LERPFDQRQAVLGQRQRQTESSKNRTVALQNQSAAINERFIKVENDQLHAFVGRWALRRQMPHWRLPASEIE